MKELKKIERILIVLFCSIFLLAGIIMGCVLILAPSCKTPTIIVLIIALPTMSALILAFGIFTGIRRKRRRRLLREYVRKHHTPRHLKTSSPN